MDFLQNFEENNAANNKNKDFLDLEQFGKDLLKTMHDTDIQYKSKEIGVRWIKTKDGRKPDLYKFGTGEVLRVCPEPLSFYHNYDDISDNKEAVQQRFVDSIDSFNKITLNSVPNNDGSPIWLNKTTNGINLRPGNLNDDRSNFEPILMGDDAVHGVIVGRTGSGKSVFVNAIICSLLTEYAPWELDIYLVDMKKVELGRYMNPRYTPHVKACGATSEIKHVISMMQNLVDKMNARQEFFARMGLTKLAELRDNYNVVLPRVILIIDEFQQLFKEASAKEADQITLLLNSITKLGRATGFHLLFASQEMSGTLGANTLSNFKIKIALPCEADISSSILGNKAASELQKTFVLINTASGDEVDNKRYKVPFIETEGDDVDPSKLPFFIFLNKIIDNTIPFGDELNYKTDTQKFYREELQEKEKQYLDDLKKIEVQKNEILNKSLYDMFDAIVLGKSILYSENKNDKVSFVIERGQRKNVAIASPSAEDVARCRKLLAENMNTTHRKMIHIISDMDAKVRVRFNLEEKLKEKSNNQIYKVETDSETITLIKRLYNIRKKLPIFVEGSTELSNVLATYEELNELLNSQDDLQQYINNVSSREKLEARIKELKEQIKIQEKANRNNTNSVIKFIKASNGKLGTTSQVVNFEDIVMYNELLKLLKNKESMSMTLINYIGKLSKQIEDLKGRDDLNVYEATMMFTCAFLRPVLEYIEYIIIEQKPDLFTRENVKGTLDTIYEQFKDDIEAEKSQYNTENSLTVDLQNAEFMLRQLEKCELENQLEKLQKQLDELVAKSYGQVDTVSIPENLRLKITASIDPDMGMCELRYSNIDSFLNSEVANILRVNLAGKKFNIINDTTQVILWINGLEMLKIGSITDQIFDFTNLNALIVGSMCSQLSDSYVSRGFNYAFVTGKLDAFYDYFGMIKTNVGLNSILINFTVVSDASDLTFKIYASDLEQTQSKCFLNDLLQEV